MSDWLKKARKAYKKGDVDGAREAHTPKAIAARASVLQSLFIL